MSFDRPLRGGCHCGRNRYLITFPKDLSGEHPKILFNHQPLYHAIHTGSPLSAYLRVPLDWYWGNAIPYYADETNAMIYKVYPGPGNTQRRFCGFCGTPLSFWSDEPRGEADYIQLTLGSLHPDDLMDLEDLGFLPDSDSDEGESEKSESEHKKTAAPQPQPHEDHDVSMVRENDDDNDGEEVVILSGRETVSTLPWFDALTEGSRLGRLYRSKGQAGNRSGTVRVEWEVVEWTEEDETPEAAKNNKRKLADRDSGGMEGVQQHH